MIALIHNFTAASTLLSGTIIAWTLAAYYLLLVPYAGESIKQGWKRSGAGTTLEDLSDHTIFRM